MKYKLIAFDMDGVLIQGENFWMNVHDALKTTQNGKVLTKKHLRTNYKKLVEEVMKLWKGKDAKPYYKLVKSVKYMRGVKKTINEIKKRGIITAIISASSLDVVKKVKNSLKIDFVFANELIIENNTITGDFVFPVGEGSKEKAIILKKLTKKLNIKLKETIYVGDTDIDIPISKIAGLSIAFNSKSDKLKSVCDVVVNSDNLSDILREIS